MSAIVGLYYLDGQSVQPDEIRRMLDTMPYRGPDGMTVWSEGPAGMGHAALNATPESVHERLPARDQETGLTLTAEIRLDNRDDLSRQLGIPDSIDVPDGRFLLEAWKKWGEDAPDRLLGDFAIACWSDRTRELHIATDHFAVRPIYYVHQPGHLFAFASEIKALLTLPEISRDIDEEAIVEFFVPELLSVDRTIYREVRLMPAAQVFRVSVDGITRRRYWSLEPERQSRRSDASHIEEFRHLFDEAVRCRLRASGPIGSELSGGLDSSYVTCRARHLLSDQGRLPLHTYSTVYDNVKECDERAYIRAVLNDSPGYEPHEVIADSFQFADLHDEILDVHDSPLLAGNHYLNWLTARCAGRDGVRILLTGLDGDTTVAHGFERFNELVREGDWKLLATEAKAYVHHVRSDPDDYAKHQSTTVTPAGVLQFAADEYIRDWAVEGHYFRLFGAVLGMRNHFGLSPRRVLRRLRSDLLAPRCRRSTEVDLKRIRKEIPDVLSDEACDTFRVVDRIAEKRRREQEARRTSSVRRNQIEIFESPYMVRTMEGLALYAAANGVEVRHPFMDTRLIRYCVSLPSDMSLRNGWTRWIMREAMRGQVPDRIVQRAGKTNLGPQYRRALATIDPGEVKSVDQQPRGAAIGALKDGFPEKIDPFSTPERILIQFGKYVTFVRWLVRES